MPRIARAVVAGMPHHVRQRGNGRISVFDSDADRAVYLLGDMIPKRLDCLPLSDTYSSTVVHARVQQRNLARGNVIKRGEN
jgi:hypothetical protein